jgi:hypothetical protein
LGQPQGTVGSVVTYAVWFLSCSAGTVMGAGRVYMSAAPALQDQVQVTIPAGSVSLCGVPGYLNTLAPGSNIVLTGPATATISTGGNVTIAAQSSGSQYYIAEDFLGSPGSSEWHPQLSGGSNAGTFSLSGTNFGTGHKGVLILATTAASPSYAWFGGQPVFFLNAGETLTFATTLKMDVAAGNGEAFVGFTDSPNAIIATTKNYLGFYFQFTGNTHWIAYTRALTVTTSFVTAVLGLNTWVNLRVVCTTTLISHYVNGVLVSTASTGIPANTAAMYPLVYYNNNTTATAYNVWLDTLEILVDSGVSGKFLKNPI